jgi:dCTP diphosphatase
MFMNDHKQTVGQLKEAVATFVQEREWKQFHTPKNLSMAIAVEAAELMEFFLWCSGEGAFTILNERRHDVEDELADILIGLLAFANACDIDISTVFTKKLAKTKKKYPPEKVRGRPEKYTQYT